jgi:hypothetical protein
MRTTDEVSSDRPKTFFLEFPCLRGAQPEQVGPLPGMGKPVLKVRLEGEVSLECGKIRTKQGHIGIIRNIRIMIKQAVGMITTYQKNLVFHLRRLSKNRRKSASDRTCSDGALKPLHQRVNESCLSLAVPRNGHVGEF